MIKVKFLFLKYYWVIALVVFAVAVIYGLLEEKPDWKILGTIITGILSYIYFIQKKNIEELSLFKELFKEFNARYDNLNEGGKRKGSHLHMS